MRLFAALDTPDAITEEIHAWWLEAATQLNIGDWRSVPTRNWHLTLAFYGDVHGGEVDDLAEALVEYVRGTVKEPLKSGRRREGEQAGVSGPIWLKTTGFGAFPKFTRPRVLWAGVDDLEDSGELKEMARCCRRAGRATVRKRSARESPFRGHITLARGNEFTAPVSAEMLAGMPPFPKLTWSVESLALFQSTLHPDGAKYRKLEEFSFEGSRYVR
ncbi:MAG: 2'-5' RNA ligase family protein [Mariprofundaceae bacterium]|nr:2'-5' RNA ligase family protein [Mariprofundaceae bacterium]